MNNGSNGSYKTAAFADCLANSKEIFQLIDRVFPVDSCRHYEVLPLKLDGNNLVLGMLKPDKEESLRFVNSIVKVFNYSLEIHLIDLQTHQIILANYPQNSPQPNRSSREDRDRQQTVIDSSFEPNASVKGASHRRIVDSAPTIISHSEAAPVSEPNLELPDLPSDLDFLKDLDLNPKPKEKATRAKPDSTATLFEIPPEFMNQKPANNLDEKATIIGGNPADLLAREAAVEDAELSLEEAKISQLIAETLENALPDEPETSDFLPELSSLSWQKLLEQAFYHRADRLKLTRYSDRGAIIAEQNHETQSAIERVELPIYCSLLDEIKRMARLPQNTAEHPKKVVLERFYEEERILLRLEFSAKEELEEVGIQILRGSDLETYEQQQMDRVSDRALQLAKELEKTLRRIQACFDSAHMTNLTELQTVYSRINHQLRLLDKQSRSL